MALHWGNNRTQLSPAFHSPINLSIPPIQDAEEDNKVNFLQDAGSHVALEIMRKRKMANFLRPETFSLALLWL